MAHSAPDMRPAKDIVLSQSCCCTGVGVSRAYLTVLMTATGHEGSKASQEEI